MVFRRTYPFFNDKRFDRLVRSQFSITELGSQLFSKMICSRIVEDEIHLLEPIDDVYIEAYYALSKVNLSIEYRKSLFNQSRDRVNRFNSTSNGCNFSTLPNSDQNVVSASNFLTTYEKHLLKFLWNKICRNRLWTLTNAMRKSFTRVTYTSSSYCQYLIFFEQWKFFANLFVDRALNDNSDKSGVQQDYLSTYSSKLDGLSILVVENETNFFLGLLKAIEQMSDNDIRYNVTIDNQDLVQLVNDLLFW